MISSSQGAGGSARFGVVVFPGSNCDHDAYFALHEIFHQDTRLLWHKDGSVGDVDVVIVPGGFAYGDYLRCGAIARFSPIMKDVISFAERGGIVIGICNGFQILCEAGLLPGALLQNAGMKFECRQVHLRVERSVSPFTSRCAAGDVLEMPIAHGEGNYYVDKTKLSRMEEQGQILFRYSDADGSITASGNPNGSLANIAGIRNERGNVMGMMPHPERASDPVLGHCDGQKIFQSVIESISNEIVTVSHLSTERSR